MSRALYCPRCGTRHYWMRRESISYISDEKVLMACIRCGLRYVVYKSENGSMTVKVGENGLQRTV